LHYTPYLGSPKWFIQSYCPSLREERLGLGTQGVASKEDKTAEQVWRMQGQRSVEPWAVEFWHTQVAEDEIILSFLEPCQGEMPVVRRIHLVAIAPQKIRQALRDTYLIINNQYGLLWRRHGRWCVGCWEGRPGMRQHGDRELNPKDCATPRWTLYSDCSAVAFNDSLAQGKSQASAYTRRFGGKKGLKNTRLQVRWDATASVGNLKHDRCMGDVSARGDS
jgi:hypothetical protein